MAAIETQAVDGREVDPAVRNAGWVSAAVLVAVFMLFLDMTVVSAALADIRSDFSASLDGLQWVIDAYSLPLAGLVLTCATIGDRIGRRKIFIAGMVVFTTASAAIAGSGTLLELDLLRVAQGVGASMLFATALPLLGTAFPAGPARTRAIGGFGAVIASATVAGPVVGGGLVTWLGWRSIFIVNVPFGIAVAVLAYAKIPESVRAGGRRTDWAGSALLTSGLFAGVFALIRGNALGWSSAWIVGLAVAAVLLITGFVARSILSGDPMFDPALIRKPAFGGLAVVSVVHMATVIAAANYLVLYLINTSGMTPLQAGLRVLPMSVSALAVAPLAVASMKRIPPAISLTAALGVVAIGMWAMADYGAGQSWRYFLPGLIVAGAALGFINVISSEVALSLAGAEDAGMASGTFGTFRQIGLAVGIAGLGALFGSVARARSNTGLDGLPVPVPDAARARFTHAVGSGAGTGVTDGLPAQYRPIVPALQRIAETSSTEALNAIMTLGAWIVTFGTVAAALAFALGYRLWRR